MSPIIILARLVAIATGGAILYTIAETNIEAGRLTGAAALKVYALGAGVLVTSALLGFAWSSKRYALTGFLALCLLAGEGYNFLKTAGRELATAETVQTAVKSAMEVRETLAANVAKAEAALEKAQAAVTADAKAKDCKDRCRDMLTGAVAAAGRDLAAARAALAGTVTPASATPLADRTGYAAWALDLLTAGLGSLAMNGFAAGLIALGAHSSGVATVKENLIVEPAKAELPRILVSDEPAPMPPEVEFEAKKAAALANGGATVDPELASLAALLAGDVEPEGNGGGPKGGARIIRPKQWDDAARDRVRADFAARVARGETPFNSQYAMAKFYGVSPATLCDWITVWRSEGFDIPRTRVGRRNVVG